MSKLAPFKHSPRIGAWYVYVLCEEGASRTGPVKIGTSNQVAYRIDCMQSGNPRRLVVLHLLEVDSKRRALDLERAVKARLTPVWLGRDWLAEDADTVIAALCEVARG